MYKYFLYDTETGGLPEKSTSLLTLYGMALDENFKVIDSIDLAIKPEDGVYRVETAALECNKIDLVKHNKTAVFPRHAAERIKNFFPANRVIPIGHNVTFDIQFLKQLLGPRTYSDLFSKRVLDTSTIAMFLQSAGKLPENLNPSLGKLADYFDIPRTNMHTAKVDAEITLKVLINLIDLGK